MTPARARRLGYRARVMEPFTLRRAEDIFDRG